MFPWIWKLYGTSNFFVKVDGVGPWQFYGTFNFFVKVYGVEDAIQFAMVVRDNYNWYLDI